MANNKTGFNYYNSDTDRYQDIKIKRLKKEFSCNGLAVYDYILNEIYRVKGCFLEWDESTAFDVSDYFGLKESVVNEIVKYCCAVGLFDKELYTNGRVITSLSIQQRYLEMCKKAKRTDFKIPEKYKIIPEQSSKIQEESRQNSVSLLQSKVKESKEKESNKEKTIVRDVVFESEVMSFFFGEKQHAYHNQLMLLCQCMTCLAGKNQLEHFKKQARNYMSFKSMTGFKHGFDKFLGNQGELFQDGKWNAENWEIKLTDEKNGSKTNQQTSETSRKETATERRNRLLYGVNNKPNG